MPQSLQRVSIRARRRLNRARRAVRRTHEEERFVAAYLVCGNVAAAARRIGITGKRAATRGHKLLKRAAVIDALRAAGIETGTDGALLHLNRREGDGLNPRQRRFVAAYRLSRNAHDAALSAGYAARSAHTMGSRQLRDPAVIAALRDAGVAITHGVHPRDQQRRRRLGARQTRFVAAYLEFGSATEAAVRAGFTTRHPGSTASRLLRNPAVTAAIAAEQEKLMATTHITAERVVRELARIGFASIGDLLDWDADGQTRLRAKEDISADGCAAIRDLVIETDARGTTRTIIKLQPKMAALAALMKHLGPPGKTATVPPPRFSDDEIAVFRAWLLPPPEPSASAADDATADTSDGSDAA